MNRPTDKRGGRGKGRGKSGGRPRPGRRTVPPDDTGFETGFLQEQKTKGATLRIHTSDGREIEGPIEDVDREMITIGQEGGSLVLRKSEIRYMQIDD